MLCAYNRSMKLFFSAVPESESSLRVFRRNLHIMDQIKPTQFKCINASELPNAEQLLCAKALDCVIDLGLFDADYFNDVDLMPTNHLLVWCVEVLTANEFDFFKRSDNTYLNYVVDSVKLQLQEEYVHSMTRPYETAYDLK